MRTSHPRLPCSNQRAKGTMFSSLDAPIPGHTPQLGPMGTGQQVASYDKVWCSSASQGSKAHLLPLYSMCPKRGRVGPFLRKPGNTLFSGLNAQILAAVTGQTHFLRAAPSHKHGLEVSLGSVKVWGHMQAHSEFQAQSWAGEGQLRLDRQGLPWDPKDAAGGHLSSERVQCSS